MSTIKNYLYNSAYQVLLFLVPLITTPYISRVLFADEIGRYSYSLTISSYFVMIIMMGLENYGNRSIAEVRDSKDNLSHTFFSIFALQLFVGVVVVVAYYLYVIFFADDKVLANIFAIVVFAACVNVSWFVYGIEKFKDIAIITTLVKVVSTIAIFVFVREKNDIVAYCLIMVISTLATNLLMFPTVFREVKVVFPSLNDIFKHFMPNVLLFLTVVSTTICKTVDKLMLGIFDPSKTQVGFYELSERIIHIPMVLVVSLGTVMLPKVANMVVKKDDSYKETITISMVFSMIIAASMSFGIMGIVNEFVPLFYGPGYETCIYLYLILLPATIFMTFSNVIRTQYMLPNHMDRKVVESGYIGLIFNVCVNAVLIPKYGAIGAAIATLLAEIISCIYQVFSVKKELQIKVYVRKVIPIVALATVMFGILFVLPMQSISIWLVLILKIVLGIIIFVIGILAYYYIQKKYGDDVSKSIIKVISGILKRKEKNNDTI